MDDSRFWLQLDAVCLRLQGRLFFRELHWQLRAGEQWAVLGANGAGKSALAQLITQRLHPSSGTIVFGPSINPAQDLGQVSFERQRALCEEDARHDISEFIDSAVDAGTTVAALIDDSNRSGAAERERLLALLGIEPLLDRGIRFLSSGEMRRSLIAAELLRRPALLLLDAPFEGIDQQSRAIVRGALEHLLTGPGHVILLTRSARDLPAGITHVLALEQGRVLACGVREEVLAQLATRNASPANATSLTLPTALSSNLNQPDTGPLIELHDVHAQYGDNTVLDGIELRLDGDEHLCIAGPNGCGKSTLLGLICGDNPRVYGQQVRLFGRLRGSGESVWEIKQRFGIVSNQLHLEYPRRCRVIDVIASGFFDTLGLYDQCGSLQLQHARDWLAVLGIEAHAQARFDTLSFGQQRMVLIARAVVKSPRVLILDEPCSGLDESNRQRVLALIDCIAAQGHTQLLYVSHELGEMPACITRSLEFRRGDDGAYHLEQVG